jgi:hypothetical protein
MSCNWGTDRLAEAVFFWGSKMRTEDRENSLTNTIGKEALALEM